jgi:hypothetical protein
MEDLFVAAMAGNGACGVRQEVYRSEGETMRCAEDTRSAAVRGAEAYGRLTRGREWRPCAEWCAGAYLFGRRGLCDTGRRLHSDGAPVRPAGLLYPGTKWMRRGRQADTEWTPSGDQAEWAPSGPRMASRISAGAPTARLQHSDMPKLLQPRSRRLPQSPQHQPPTMVDDCTAASHSSRPSRRLAESAYNSPYARAGAPTPHPNSDPYASLRSKALATLESMGYDPQTMVERGIVWAEDQDPFGHVMQSQYMTFLGTCFHRVMESYDAFLSDVEYNDMIQAKSVIPVVRKYELDIRRQVKYPDTVSIINKHDGHFD